MHNMYYKRNNFTQTIKSINKINNGNDSGKDNNEKQQRKAQPTMRLAIIIIEIEEKDKSIS